MPATTTSRREVVTLFGAVLLRAVRTVKIMLFVPSERARDSTQGGEEWIKICYVRSCSGSLSCSCTLRELELLHKECVYLICVVLLCRVDNIEI